MQPNNSNCPMTLARQEQSTCTPLTHTSTALAPSDRAAQVATRLGSMHGMGSTHVMPLPSPEIVSSLLRRDLDRVRAALTSHSGDRHEAVREAMEALPRARRLAALLESLIPILTAAEALRPVPPRLKKAPKEAVESLPERKWSVNDSSSGKTECYICLQDYESGDLLRRLPCNHEFHSKCVDKWLLDVHKTCPCCRKPICEEDTEEAPAEPTRDLLRPSAPPSGGPSLRMSMSSNAHRSEAAARVVGTTDSDVQSISDALRRTLGTDTIVGGGDAVRRSFAGSALSNSEGYDLLRENGLREGGGSGLQRGRRDEWQVRASAALGPQAAANQVSYVNSQNQLSESLSTLQNLRERQSALSQERERLEQVHRGLCNTRDQLSQELNQLRGSVSEQGAAAQQPTRIAAQASDAASAGVARARTSRLPAALSDGDSNDSDDDSDGDTAAGSPARRSTHATTVLPAAAPPPQPPQPGSVADITARAFAGLAAAEARQSQRLHMGMTAVERSASLGLSMNQAATAAASGALRGSVDSSIRRSTSITPERSSISGAILTRGSSDGAVSGGGRGALSRADGADEDDSPAMRRTRNNGGVTTIAARKALTSSQRPSQIAHGRRQGSVANPPGISRLASLGSRPGSSSNTGSSAVANAVMSGGGVQDVRGGRARQGSGSVGMMGGSWRYARLNASLQRT